MKKLYTLSLVLFGMLSGFSQIFTDNLNYANDALLTDNGWTALTNGAGTNPITVGASNGLSFEGYTGTTGITGAAAGNAALLDATGEDVRKDFTAVPSGTIFLSFLASVTSPSDIANGGYFIHLGKSTASDFVGRVYMRPSTTPEKVNFGISNNNTVVYGTTDFDLNTTYFFMVKYEVSTAGTVSLWVIPSGLPQTEAEAGTPEATSTGAGQVGISSVHLRQFAATQNVTVDAIYADLSWFGGTPPPVCPVTLATPNRQCDSVTAGVDTYTTTIPFTGGGTATYTLNATAGTISGDNPSTTEAGNIIISGVQEGTNFVFTLTGGDCSLTQNITSQTCTPPPTEVTLPYVNQFEYSEGATLGSQTNWTNYSGNTDEILVGNGSLQYTNLPFVGNSILFGGGGIDTYLSLPSVNSGTLYYSFLINVSNVAAVTNANGGYFAGFASSNTEFGGTLWAKKVDDTTFNFGTEVRTAAAANTSWTADAYSIGQTYLVVVGYTFGDATSDDTVNLWINPTVGAAQPTPTITDTHTGTDLTAITRFFFRQDTTEETPDLQIDLLRVATTWEGVTDTSLSIKNNSISGLKVYPNPVTNGILNIETAANTERNVQIFDIVGKQVVNLTTATNNINVSALRSGVYVAKITEEGKTATVKFVVK